MENTLSDAAAQGRVTKQQPIEMGPLKPYRPPPAWKSTSMKVTEINNQLTELQEKCTRLFKGTYSKPKSSKRKQKPKQEEGQERKTEQNGG